MLEEGAKLSLRTPRAEDRIGDDRGKPGGKEGTKDEDFCFYCKEVDDAADASLRCSVADGSQSQKTPWGNAQVTDKGIEHDEKDAP